MEQNLDKPTTSLKTIDKWVAYLARHAWIKTIIFITAFLEASISPVLPELVIAAVLSYRKDISWKLLSVISALGTSLGMVVLYILGFYFYEQVGETLVAYLGAASVMAQAETLFATHAFMTLLVASFTPLPDRVFAFASGVFGVPIIIVFSAVFLARFVRASIVAYTAYEYGDEARAYALKHARLVTMCFVGVLVMYVFYRVFI